MNPNFFGKNHFDKNPLYLRIIADFEADNEIDISIIGNKTITIYKQKPVLNGHYIISELEFFKKKVIMNILLDIIMWIGMYMK